MTTIKKNEIMPFAVTWMDLQIIILSEVLQTMINSIWYHFYVVSRKMIQMNLFTKQKQTHRKQIYGYQRGEQRGAGEEGERDKLGVWESHRCEMGIPRLTLRGCSEAVRPCSKEQNSGDKRPTTLTANWGWSGGPSSDPGSATSHQ